MAGGLWHVTRGDAGRCLRRRGKDEVSLMAGVLQQWVGAVGLAWVAVGMRVSVEVGVRVGLRMRQREWKLCGMWHWGVRVVKAEGADRGMRRVRGQWGRGTAHAGVTGVLLDGVMGQLLLQLYVGECWGTAPGQRAALQGVMHSVWMAGGRGLHVIAVVLVVMVVGRWRWSDIVVAVLCV